MVSSRKKFAVNGGVGPSSPSSLAALRNTVAALETQNAELLSDNEGLRNTLSMAAVLNPGKQMQRLALEALRDTERKKVAIARGLQDADRQEKAMQEEESGLVEAGQALRARNRELALQKKELQMMFVRAQQEQTDLTQDKEDLATQGNAALLEQDRLLTAVARIQGLEPRLLLRPVGSNNLTSSIVSATGGQHRTFLKIAMGVLVSPAATRGPAAAASAAVSEKPERPMPSAALQPMRAVDDYLMDAQINPEEQVDLEWPKPRPAAAHVSEESKPKAEPVTLKEALAMTSFEDWVRGRVPVGL